MSNSNNAPILVVGATGNQGGAVVNALLQAGRPVRALVRDAESEAGEKLAARGVEVFAGDLDNIASLDAAMAGAAGVFSMQTPSTAEVRHGKALVEAAHRAGVDVFVHSSVARAGDQETFVGWDKGLWSPAYWENKAAVNELVKAQGFRHWVILKPSLMMHNLLPPVADFMFPALSKNGQIDTANEPGSVVDWIAAQDIGAFAAAAFADPERFHDHEIPLAAESLPMDALAAKLTQGTGKKVTAVSSSEEDLVARGGHPGVVSTQVWNNVEGYKVDIDATRSWGVPLTSFDAFIAQNRDKFVIG